MTTKDVQLGRRYRFTYPYYGTPDLHPDYTAHSGQLVTLVREILPPERDIEAGRTFEAKASDGWTGTVSIYELQPARSMSDTKWRNDSIQFPRLLAEIMGSIEFTAAQRDTLQAEMDLSWEEITEVFERAQTTWERIKEGSNRNEKRRFPVNRPPRRVE